MNISFESMVVSSKASAGDLFGQRAEPEQISSQTSAPSISIDSLCS
jgi:hypothetical protein